MRAFTNPAVEAFPRDSPTLFGDRPITTEAEDRLGFTPFAEAVARSLVDMVPPDGLVLSIEAEWGAGKTSAVELIARRLKLRELSRLHGAEFVERASHVSAANLDDIWSESEEERRLHAGYARREVAFGPDTGAGSANAKCYPLTL